MATVEHHHHGDSGSGVSVIAGILLAIVLVFAGLFFFTDIFRGRSADHDVDVNVSAPEAPDAPDINIETPRVKVKADTD